jgi:hypothetical protein
MGHVLLGPGSTYSYMHVLGLAESLSLANQISNPV